MQEWPLNTQLALPVRLLRYKPIITHCTSHIGPIWGPGKLVVTVHDLIFRRYPHDYNPFWLFITRITLPTILRRAVAIVADSQATKNDIQHFYGVRTGKIVVIYPGVDEAYTTQRHTMEAQSNPYILCLGPWVRRKNLPVVVRAFEQIARQMPDLRLLISGEPSTGMKGYTAEELVGPLPEDIRSRVELLGYVARDDLPHLVGNATLLAYPSRWEGFGLPPLEAMLAGVPVVATRTPVVEEVTAGAADLCNPDNPGEWVKAFYRVVMDKNHAKRMVEAGLRRSAAFTWERCATQTASLYHRVAHKASASGNNRWA